ncbi:hypothetical protein GCM10018793_69380 [Streptomyces sulfonofaciens]|uniref:3-octaprenyl-4-hydroxybenzoate carboxy-lyase-like Rift-related domain-containing protein n=1 Tax=Streptomyces sulfonofaciens TaxID=68272 RepID=A0A919GQ59_9ACTN|nr:UbiD family decarboxylase domain-containing protein [Streptomyces sulfonofaciens]GHH88717.1 hypothetical protein GCM10018793_69380 [Streptomyces sulfonofaciens]
MPKETRTKEQVAEFVRRWADFPVPPEWRAGPPWAESGLEGDDADIFQVLPLIRLNEGDGGLYIDKDAVVSRDPDDPDDPDSTGKQNVGIYRTQVKGRRKLAIQPGAVHDIAHHLRKAEETGEDLLVAIALGNDPVIPIVAATPMAYDGGEVVIEGFIEARKRELEGLFGEFTGHCSGGRRMPVIRVDRISHRTGLRASPSGSGCRGPRSTI